MSKKKIYIWGEFPTKTHTGVSISNEQILNFLTESGCEVKVCEEFSWSYYQDFLYCG